MKKLLAGLVALAICTPLLAAGGPSPAAPPEPADMKQLFNGKDLSGWEGDMRLWSWQDGVVRGQTTKENVAKGNTFLIYRGGEDGKPKVVGKLGDKDAIGKTYKKSDWNDYVIIAKGNHIQHFLNGWQTVDIVDNDPNKDKGAASKGLLALQIHAGPPMTVEFKNVRLKELK